MDNTIKMKDPKKALKKTFRSFRKTVPILLGVLLLVALITTAVPKSFYTRIFTENSILDPIIGSVFGSVATGNPLTSYVIGGELLDKGVSLIAVVAFISSWVTVGLVQLPAESKMLGRRFAIVRNFVSFFSSIVVAILTVFFLGFL